MPWISVRNWRKFQHYDPDKRVPPWIKNHTELMANDDYLSLTGHDRAVLHGIWLEYASSRCQLRLDDVSITSRARFGTRFGTLSLSRRLNLRVTSATVDRLNHAGFIDIVASKALAEGYQDASARAHATEAEKEEEEPPPTPTVLRDAADLPNFDRILKDVPA